MAKKRKPTHPGKILEEHYIKPLNLCIVKLAEYLEISRTTLDKIRKGHASISAALAITLAQAFDTSPELWLNLQQKYDLWIENQHHEAIKPLVKGGEPQHTAVAIAAKSYH